MPKLARFAFDLGDRVMIPFKGITFNSDCELDAVAPLQGIVSGRKDITAHENEYDVHFLNPDLSLAHIICGEAALNSMQPKAPKRKAKRKH